jgi:peptide deformylase
MINTPHLDAFNQRLESSKGRRQILLATIRIVIAIGLYLVFYKVYHRNDISLEPIVESKCEQLELISPAEYEPTRCKLVTAADEAKVLEYASRLIDLAIEHNHGTLTSYSLGVHYCMFVSKELTRGEYQVFLNPRVQSKTQFIRVKEKSVLCRYSTSKTVAQNVSFFADVKDLSNQRRHLHASQTAAMSIHHALDVLEGNMKCQ